MFLIHFVGDLHQPLHTAGNGQAGGSIQRRYDKESARFQPARIRGYVLVSLGDRSPLAIGCGPRRTLQEIP